jgi:rhodanese-related sulfurtransferase
MANTTSYTASQRGLVQQGYLGYSPEDLAKLNWGLRFTPTVCMAGALVGLATQTPWIHFVLAALGTAALLFPAHHPLDLLYNHGVRSLTGGPKLPPNPLPRRVACLLGGLMNLGIGLSFQAGVLWSAYVLGAVLVVLQLIVISAHFCVASWLLEIGMALKGRRIELITSDEARRLVADGAVLLDVRSTPEFELEHIPGAENVPVNEVEARKEELLAKHKPFVIYCAAGARCHTAAETLRRAGCEEVHELGSMKRW